MTDKNKAEYWKNICLKKRNIKMNNCLIDQKKINSWILKLEKFLNIQDK